MPSPNPLFQDLTGNAAAAKKQLREGRLNFIDAMAALGMTSVFDIIRLSKNVFVERLAGINDDDGERAYDNAMCYAIQIGRAYREQRISSGRKPLSADRNGVRALVEVGPSYPNLFKENWQSFCKVGAIEAVDSPVAYLSALYRLAVDRYEALPAGNTAKIPLHVRRPDLPHLLIDQQSTFKSIPMLDIVIKVLTQSIEAYRATTEDPDTPLLDLLASKRYPFEFPYDFGHQQALLGLSGKNSIALGALNYRISRALPSSTGPAFGQLPHPATEAQRLLSGLSPEQQRILIEPSPFATVYYTRSELNKAQGAIRMPGVSTFNAWAPHVIAYLVPTQDGLRDALNETITTNGSAWPTELAGVDPQDQSHGPIPLTLSSVEDGNGNNRAPNSLTSQGLLSKCSSLISPSIADDAPLYQGRFTLVATAKEHLDGNHYGAKAFLRRTLSVNLSDLHELNAEEKQQLQLGYGISNPLELQELDTLTLFMSRTGLDADGVERVLARRSHAPVVSPHVISLNALAAGGLATVNRPFPHPLHYGAGYVNGVGAHLYPRENYSPQLFENAMDIAEQFQGESRMWEIVNTSYDRFDRLQRMIRLQRWLQIPFNELDTLLMSVIRSEREHNLDKQLNLNTLRTLGVYKHLSARTKIHPEEFAAFLHYLCPYATGDEEPLFDKVFNQAGQFETPLVLDNTDFSLELDDQASQKTIAQLCAGLKLQPSQDSFYLLASETLQLVAAPSLGTGKLVRNLWTVSSLYRQARIARLFGLSAKACWQLLDLLGGAAYRQAVASGQLRPAADAGANATPDILDILMQLEWAIDWLAATGFEIAQLRQWLGKDTDESPPSEQLLQRLGILAQDARNGLVTEADIISLGLPTTEDEEAGVEPALIDWAALLLHSELVPEGQVATIALTIPDSTAEQIEVVLTGLLAEVKLAPANRARCIAILHPFILNAQQRQARLIEGFISEQTGLPMGHTGAALLWHGASLADVYHAVKTLQVPAQQIPPLITTSLRYAYVLKALGPSELALRTFAVYPQRLSATQPTQALTLDNLYLLERYCRLVETRDAPEEQLLAYLKLANETPAGRPSKARRSEHARACAQALAVALGWSGTEVTALAQAMLSNGIASSMADIDWLHRCRDASDATGLAATGLLAAAALNANSTNEQWRAVGEAVMAGQR